MTITDEMVERGRDYGGCDFTQDGSCAAVCAQACICGTHAHQLLRKERRTALEAALSGKEEK